MEKIANPAGSRGLKVSAEPVPTAVETLEHLEQTLDNLDPVVPVVPEGTLDAAADAVIADIAGDPSVDAIETPAPDDAGSLAEIGRE